MTIENGVTSNSVRPNGFRFRRPEDDPTLSPAANLVCSMAAIAGRLVQEERSLCAHPDGRPENVAEHSVMLAKVAVELARLLYPHLDAGQVALAALNHDDVEAYVGDTPTHNITADGLMSKAAREAEGLGQLVAEYRDVAPGYAKDVQIYEAQEDPHVRFVRVVDKMMVLLVHLPNDGLVLREKFTREAYIAHRAQVRDRLIAQYPEYQELIELEKELSGWLADRYLGDEAVVQSHK